MNQTPEFIEMCRELPDTFTPDREYEIGDYVHDRYLNKTYVVADGGAEKTPVTSTCIRADSGSITDCFWLPKQNQLQAMYQVHFGPILNIYGVTRNFSDYVFVCVLGECSSMEQMWLAFVMHERYNMIWTGSKWMDA